MRVLYDRAIGRLSVLEIAIIKNNWESKSVREGYNMSSDVREK